MPRQIDPDSFGFLIGDVSRLLRAEIDRRTCAAGLGITPGESRTLAHAARAGTVRQNVLAERMGVEPMTLSGFLDRLEARGLVKRTPDPTDRRAKLVHLTPAADPVLAEAKKIGSSVRRHLATSMSAEEWALLQDLLKRIRCTLSGRDGEASESDAA